MLRRLIGRLSSPPDSFDRIANDIATRLPSEQISLFFDVGANNGQTVEKIKKRFPSARIFSFEPNPATFRTLSANTKGLASAFGIGLSSSPGMLRFDTSAGADMHRIADDQSDERFPAVQVKTLDAVGEELKIERIDYLKVDTEGHDLEVLKGAEILLSQSRISIIETECGANRENSHHVHFSDVNAHLENKGYRLFGIYEQVTEWPASKPHLRRVNAVFISTPVIARNTYRPW